MLTLLCSLCTSLVNVTGSHTEDEPSSNRMSLLFMLLDTSLYCIQQHYPAVKSAADRF